MSSTANSGDRQLSVSVLRRRNGRQQACEPCRKRKVSCDHTLPVCVRCKRRGDSCVYIIQGRVIMPTPADAARNLPASLASGDASSGPLQGDPKTLDRTGTGIDRVQPNENMSPGYLGATSFTPILQETKERLSATKLFVEQPLHDNPLSTKHWTPSAKSPISGKKLENCLRVLRSVPRKDQESALFFSHINPNDGWVRLGGERLLDSLYADYGYALSGERNSAQLEAMAQKLCDNTAVRFPEDTSDPEEWLNSFTGSCLRWEALGILFTYWAFGANAADESDPTDLDTKRRNAMSEYMECASLCISLSEESDGNTLLLYLMYKTMLLESNVSGDASLACWRRHGELVALTTYLGRHAEPKTLPYEPTISSEVHRRLAAAVFNIDKVTSSFTGRPPLLSRRYFSTPLPLDVSDADLLSEPRLLIQAVKKLDGNGWSQGAKVHSAMILRARTMMALIRDEILEIALGTSMDENLENLLQLREKEINVIGQFPPILQYNHGDIDNQDFDAPTFYAKLLVRLEHLQNMFLIERLLLQRASGSSTGLLNISTEMVSLTLRFWTHSDRLHRLRHDFEWLVMSYAAPAGGILCLELLKPENRASSVSVTRSTIIQKLSLLVGFLDWVGPTAPNGNLTKAVGQVMKRVLDQTLNPEPSITHPLIDFWEPDLSNEVTEFFNFDLLDTFDWLRPDGGAQGL